MANKNIYRQTGGTSNTSWDTVRNWVIFLSDGSNSPLEMSVQTGIPVKEIEKCGIIDYEKLNKLLKTINENGNHIKKLINGS